MWLLPLPADAIERHGGGLLATIVLPPDHEIWQFNDVDGMYEEVGRNFAYMRKDVTEVVTREHMNQFVKGRFSTFPAISHLPAVASPINGVAVIALDEAAHTMPPDMGQGLNALIEDVTILSSILSSSFASADVDWCKVAAQYQDERFWRRDGTVRTVRVLGTGHRPG